MESGSNSTGNPTSSDVQLLKLKRETDTELHKMHKYDELRHLPLDERLSIIEFLTQIIKDEVKPA